MTNERKAELFDNAMAWILEHTKNHGVIAYVKVLRYIGYTPKEIGEELARCYRRGDLE